MSEAPTKFTRRHKLLLASLATVSLSLGAAGIVSAANDPAEADTEGSEAEENDAEENEEVDGVDCENGIDAATGAECDGGPSANPQDENDDAAEESSEAANE